MPDFEFDFPEGFCVVCDTREQTALFVPKAPKGLVLVRDTLKYGDYSIRGFETCIAIERKNIDDLLTSVTSERERFKKELIVLSEYDRKYILVEGLESAVLCYHDNRKIHPNSIRWALASIEAKLGIPIHYAATKKDAERFVLDLFISWYKMKRSGV
jgi:ERCC4-type nuclease